VRTHIYINMDGTMYDNNNKHIEIGAKTDRYVNLDAKKEDSYYGYYCCA